MLTLLTLTISIGFGVYAIQRGHLYPRPAHDGRNAVQLWDQLHVAKPEGVVGVPIEIYNESGRMLRLSELRFDAPGAELAAIVQVRGNPYSPQELLQAALAGGDTDILPLPIPGDRGSESFIAWFRPLQCEDSAESWGTLNATLDFGEGGLPWTSRTFSSEPLWERGGQVAAYPLEGDGPLAVMCEALR